MRPTPIADIKVRRATPLFPLIGKGVEALRQLVHANHGLRSSGGFGHMAMVCCPCA